MKFADVYSTRSERLGSPHNRVPRLTLSEGWELDWVAAIMRCALGPESFVRRCVERKQRRWQVLQDPDDLEFTQEIARQIVLRVADTALGRPINRISRLGPPDEIVGMAAYLLDTLEVVDAQKQPEVEIGGSALIPIQRQATDVPEYNDYDARAPGSGNGAVRIGSIASRPIM